MVEKKWVTGVLADSNFIYDIDIFNLLYNDIEYSTLRNGTSLEGKLVKPLIVVEGYDITDASRLLKPDNYEINNLIASDCEELFGAVVLSGLRKGHTIRTFFIFKPRQHLFQKK